MSLLQCFGRFEQAWRFSLFCFCDHAQLCAPNSIRDLNGRSYPTYPILRVLFGQLADNVLLILVQRIIDTAVHRHSGDWPPARTDRQSGRING